MGAGVDGERPPAGATRSGVGGTASDEAAAVATVAPRTRGSVEIEGGCCGEGTIKEKSGGDCGVDERVRQGGW